MKLESGTVPNFSLYPPRRRDFRGRPWAYNEARIRFRLRWARRAEYENGTIFPKNEREWRFCAIFAREAVVRAMKDGGRLTDVVRAEAAAQAAREAGYPEKREFAVKQRGLEQLALPRVQSGITEIFRQCGVDLSLCGATIHGVMINGSDADKLKAVELVIKATTGFAPTKTANIHGIAPVDGFFDEREFSSTPPIKTLSGDDVKKPRSRSKR